MRGACVAAVVLVAGCTSETMERDQMGIYKSATPGGRQAEEQRKPDPEPEAEKPKGKVITVGPEAAAQWEDFKSRKATLFSDAVDVDMSREGWIALATFAFSRDAVIRRDEEDARRGVLTITLQRIPNVAPTQDSVPTIRFGDGLRIIGVDRVVLRFWTQPSAARPVWFHALAAGKKAVYAIETEPPQRWEGRSVEVRSELHLVGETYRFDWSAEGRP